MPIVSNASNRQMNVGKVQIKGGYHGNLPWVTCHEKELQARLLVLGKRRT